MRRHYKKPDVCQPFKETRDGDKRCFRWLAPRRRAGLKWYKQLLWWDPDGRVGASSPGVSMMLPPPATHMHVLKEAQQQRFPGKTHNGIV